MNKQKGFTALEIVFTVLAVISVYGWCANVYKLFTVGVPLLEFGVMEIMRVIGVFAVPVGVVLGFF